MIIFSKEKSVASIGIDSKYNALDLETIRDLKKTLGLISTDESVKIVVFYGEKGRFFCTGASPDEIKQCKTREDFDRFCDIFPEILKNVRELPQFTVAKIRGKSSGSGVSLGAACDMCFGLRGCCFRMSEMLYGFDPMIVADPLLYKIGIGSLKEIILNPAHWFSDIWALQHGLLDAIAENEYELSVMMGQAIQTILASNPKAIYDWKVANVMNSSLQDIEQRLSVTGNIMFNHFTCQ